jgi:hypothetical protein
MGPGARREGGPEAAKRGEGRRRPDGAQRGERRRGQTSGEARTGAQASPAPKPLP